MSESHIPPEERSQTPASETAAPDQPTSDSRPNANGFGWLQALTVALAVLLVLFTFVGRIIGVDGTSMVPTLNHGDLLFIQSLNYTPEAGDIVVLHKDFADITSPIVKRIIAVGGQTVEVNYNTSTVYVDGQPLEEPYINEVMFDPAGPYTSQTFWEIPEGSVFVMGDNRNYSSDSRDERLGIIDNRYILGHAVFTLFPLSSIGPIH